MKEKKLYKIAFMGDMDHGCDIISTLESWGGSNYYLRTGSDPEYAYFINDLGTIDFIHNSALLSEEMKNFYFLFWHDYNIECQLKVGETINYGGQDYDVDSILFDANNRCIVYKLKSFGIGVEYITNNELTPTEEYQMEEENNEYLTKNNMKTKLAIQGHPTRGKEVIKLLEMLGGNTFNSCMEIAYSNRVYYIGNNNAITWDYIGPKEIDKYEIFTLEKFLEKYPFKVGDVVFDVADGDIGTIAVMKWDEDVSDMKYRVDFNNGDIGWFTNDTIYFYLNKDNKEMNGNIETNQCKVNGLKRGDEYPIMEGVECNECIKYYFPDGYEFVDTDDTGVYLKPIKSKYPKTYVECCKILDIREEKNYTQGYKCGLITKFQELFIARNVYWKIAGEEMGLGKPWEPSWQKTEEGKFCIIRRSDNVVTKWETKTIVRFLAFPTKEMRDAFYENFKDLIEQCKELL